MKKFLLFISLFYLTNLWSQKSVTFEYDKAGNQIKRFYLVIVRTPEERSVEANPTIYPNPTTGIFKVYLDEETLKKAKNIRIFNDLGQLVYDKVLKNGQEEYTVDISRLPKGIYFVTIALSNKKIITKKMIKQ